MKPLFLIASLWAIGLLAGCSKDDSPATNNTAPTNLTVTATASTDNSGNVAFTATATNAVAKIVIIADCIGSGGREGDIATVVGANYSRHSKVSWGSIISAWRIILATSGQ